ncbi:MAG: HEPN domain-containing protein [Anaerolineae bacterium]|nr:HEPN domain-containing protein [Caldilineales bacterium]MCX7853408.1 HEPN domain-containing protein [Caldilineales bacterium]MDW8268190.1 HEPN domain-containing protein [Anaerolineae bacterium]
MSDEIDLARGWLAKAVSDIHTARLLVKSGGPYDTACFHAQQAIEKALKGFLALHRQPIPRTHDLDELQATCLALVSLSELAALDLTQVTDYGVLVRYDLDFWPDRAAAADALALAETVFGIITNTLPATHRPNLPTHD